MSCKLKTFFSLACLLPLLILIGCGEGPAPQPPPPPAVTVTSPVVRSETRYFEYTGNTKAVNQVDIIARVPGFVVKQNYELLGEDNRVKRVEAGDLLFEIEHEPYQIAVDLAEADMNRAEALEAAAKATYENTKKSFDRGAASDLDLTTAEADYKQRTAERQAAKAQLDSAKLDLSYTYVKSPIAGEVSRNLVDVGTYVGGSGGPTLLTRVTQTKPIYVYFDVSEDIVQQHIARSTERGEDYAQAPPPFDLATSADEKGTWSHQGVVDWWDRSVDRKTGTIVVRGKLDNEDGSLVPGLFVRVRAPFEQIEAAVLVREEAIGTDLSGKYVLLVVEDEKGQPVVKKQPVTLSMRADDGLRVVEGLPADATYIVKSIQKVRPGMVVNAQQEEPASRAKPEAVDPGAEPAEGNAKPAEKPAEAAPAKPEAATDGDASLPMLPVEQYPEIAPPNVQISASYPGADPATIVDTVTAPIEQEVNGVEGMIYMKSTTDQTGAVSINVTFELGTDPDLAVVYTQNRVSAAEPRLPEEVRSRGVSVTKRSPSLLMVATLISPDDSFDFLSLSNYTTLYLKDELARIEGVSEVFIFGGQDYAMRIWLDPEELASRSLTTVDVLSALREQNVQVAAGRIGAPPKKTPGAFEYIVNAEGRLSTVEEFENIILKTADAEVDDQTVTRTLRLKDVARVELGAETYDWQARLNGKAGVGIGIYQMPGSNAIDVADAVKARLDELAVNFPQGIEHQITFDFTNFVRSSVEEVVTTLFIAALLVVIITFIFLQDWRATIVPTVTIPVSLIATFGVMVVFDFSINLFTLFGLILAIGIVVDDAIVVVEDTSRRITEGMAPRDAAKETMKEVTGALIATTLVVLAVFIPASMIGGLTGTLYQQFALTIVFATCFSTINALTLSPMLCALILKPAKPVRFPLFKLFNATLDKTRGGYLWFVNKGIRLAILTILVFGGITAAAVFGFKLVPTGFLPNEDQGYFFVNIQLPDGSQGERTLEVLEHVEAIAAKQEGVRDTKAQRLGVSPSVYNDTLQTNLGGSYVNDFNYLNRVFRVFLQSESEFRDESEDIKGLKVRNAEGDIMPIGTFLEVDDTSGPQAINRYNLYPSASITAQPTAGRSTGEAIQAMRDLSAEQLPEGFSYDWTGATYQELETGSAAVIAFVLGIIVVFLVLSAQYESWTTPIAILLTIPLGVLGALLGIFMRGYDINIYTQVGFILLIALVAKNAILIVEFAKQRSEQGLMPKEAAIEAAGLRFRPILMTAFSFVAGTAPLVIAVGAGAMSRRSLGTAVFFGMIVATVIGVVFVPVFYYVIQTVMGKLKREKKTEAPATSV
eukprot:g14256.t1